MSGQNSPTNNETKEQIHDHVKEVESSRPHSNTTRLSNASLGPLRTGRGTPTEVSPVGSSLQSLSQDIPRKSPLPPIASDYVERNVTSPESEVDMQISDENAATVGQPGQKKVERAGRKRHPKVLKGYRSEPFDPDEKKYEYPSDSVKEWEKITVRGVDGKERTLVSMECQTEWSWLEDFQRMQAFNERHSQFSTGDHDVDIGADADSDADDSDGDKELINITTITELETPEPATSLNDVTSTTSSPTHSPQAVPSGVKSPAKTETPKAKEDESKQLQASIEKPAAKKPTSVGQSSTQEAPSLGPSTAPSLRDDDYGIPILQLITDTDYNRESEKKEIDPGDPDNLDLDVITKFGGVLAGKLPNLSPSLLLPDAPQGGIFQGSCEFCGQSIKKFPTMEEQKVLPPEQLYCCDEYRQFVQFMVSHPLHEKFNLDKMIDISPHAPYGSKQARNAAKERAAQSEMIDAEALAARMKAKMRRRERKRAPVSFARQMKTINYCLSSQKCLEEGWTIRPPSPLLEGDQETEVFEPQPILPPWADPEKQYQLYHRGCAHKYKPHFHNIFYQPDDTSPALRNTGLVRKFYLDGSKFIILFPDGTGNVFYPSGRVAVSIVALEEKGLYSYIVTEDVIENCKVLAVFEQTGCGTTYYQNGAIRVCLDQLGGVELDAHGAKKRKWSWKDRTQHVHAPPIQPITLAINQQVAVRIMGQDNISLTFTANKRSVRFQVGAHLKLVSPENIPEPEIDDDQLFRDEVRNRIQELLLKVNNLLKFPKSPKLDKLPNPPHLTAKQQKTEKLRTLRREKTMAKDKKQETPVVIVN